MSKNIQALLVVLALGALGSVFYIASVFRQPTIAALADPANQKGNILSMIPTQGTRDTDHDGLTDQEETYWRTDFQKSDSDGDGFTDGEEVLSGHDPAKKGPLDWLDNSKNLTQRTANLIAGGILTGALQPGSSSYDAAAQKIATDIVEKYQQNNQIVIDKVLSGTDSAKDKAEYLATMVFAIEKTFAPTLKDGQQFAASIEDIPLNNPALLTDNTKRYVAFVTAAHTLGKNIDGRVAILTAIPAPPTYLNNHREAIRILRLIQRQYELTATLKEDSMQGMLAIRMLVQLYTQTIPRYTGNLLLIAGNPSL